MKHLQAQEINMVSGGDLRERVASALVNNSFLSSLVGGAFLGGIAHAHIAGVKAPTAVNVLAGGIFGAYISAFSYYLGLAKSRSEQEI